MTKKKGRCRNENCSEEISHDDKANELRLCDKHYLLWQKNKIRLFKNNVERIAQKTISKNEIMSLGALIAEGRAKKEIKAKKEKRLLIKWFRNIRARRSSVTHILKSREWNNTQELMNRRYIICKGPEFMSYVQDVCNLYTSKLLHSREYLKKENAYKKYIYYNIKRIKPDEGIITLNLEVAWVFNQDVNVSIKSQDVILLPTRIRRMVSQQKYLLKRKIKEPLISRCMNGNVKSEEEKNTRKTGGVYNRLKKENNPTEVKKFMRTISESLLPDTRNMHYYKPFGYFHIEDILPLFHLALQQYRRLYGSKATLFWVVKKLWLLPAIYLEFFALLSLYHLSAGKGLSFHEKVSTWVNPVQVSFKLELNEFVHELNEMFNLAFKIKLENKIKLTILYNSCFSGAVIKYNEWLDEISSIIVEKDENKKET
ncbi:hypothetical protein OGY34_14685 [Citrobacter sp. Cy232]|uniref:hypothetical protein n=1 Tax=Citrobacter sp. Cy232 TaxID=2985164 RepID=UPI002577877E|nr:hypothetical protein [Citrobacter sp. Cy232]MDM2717698.1 hypothetical protein [Citrobacter sp. Cy232]